MEHRVRTGARFAAFLILLTVVNSPGNSTARDQKVVEMAVSGPECAMEVVYTRTYDGGAKKETYGVHAEEIEVNGIPAYQSISVYKDRVRWVTMRKSDLSPIAVVEEWNDKSKLIERTYYNDKVHMVRKNLPYPLDTVEEVPPGVHDPETFAFLLKGYPFEMQDSISPISVLFADPIPVYSRLFSKPMSFDVVIIPKGVEKVTVPAGTFQCYVLEMTLDGVFGRIVPENRFWLLKEDPHMVIKAEGAGELIEFEAGPFPCDREGRCEVGARIPEYKPLEGE